jgi:hypothetical protein
MDRWSLRTVDVTRTCPRTVQIHCILQSVGGTTRKMLLMVWLTKARTQVEGPLPIPVIVYFVKVLRPTGHCPVKIIITRVAFHSTLVTDHRGTGAVIPMIHTCRLMSRIKVVMVEEIIKQEEVDGMLDIVVSDQLARLKLRTQYRLQLGLW